MITPLLYLLYIQKKRLIDVLVKFIIGVYLDFRSSNLEV